MKLPYTFPIADLHCDLLLYLAKDPKRTPLHPEVRCSLPQLQKGNVALQTLAVFAETIPGSSLMGKQQFLAYSTLSTHGFIPLKELKFPVDSKSVHTIAAIENASALCEENEPLDRAFERMNLYRKLGPILYVSLTWNTENRFGGGNTTTVGLKKDGECFLDFLEGKGIAIDLSHTSDQLADGILNYIDKKGLSLIPIASHSNFRKVTAHPRNLPDEIALEIARRKGLIGFNAVKKFVGDPFSVEALRHLEHAARLGLLGHLCFGADFFYLGDLPPSLINPLFPSFDPLFEDASCYPQLLQQFKTVLSREDLEGMTYRHVAGFLPQLQALRRS